MRSANSRNPARRPPVGWDPRGPDQLGLLERPLGPEGLQGPSERRLVCEPRGQ
jgi:hypothetical protein